MVRHVLLVFDAVQTFLSIFLFGFAIRLRKHVMHCRNQKACGARTGVQNYVIVFDGYQVAKQISNVLRRENNPQRLTIAAGIRHEFTIEAPKVIFGGFFIVLMLL